MKNKNFFSTNHSLVLSLIKSLFVLVFINQDDPNKFDQSDFILVSTNKTFK